MKNYDAIIVGSGAGGATAASVLTKRGWNVVVLEKGGWKNSEEFLPYDEMHFSEHKSLSPEVENDPLIYVDTKSGKEKNIQQWWLANMVGGATMVWEANLPRYTEEDFKITKYLRDIPKDTSMVDWPWTYEEFQPYFEKAEWDWGVSGAVNQSPAQEPTRKGYNFPMPPIKPHASNQFLMDAFRKHGMYPYQSSRGINSVTFDGRPACPYCGFCQSYGCAVNDRATASNTVLKKALETGRCDVLTNHNVIRILYDKGVASGVVYKTEANGKEKVLKSKRVIVSIQAIQSARLFLNSEIPDPNKLVGKYLTYHTKGNLEMVFKNSGVWGDYRPDSLFQPRTSLGSLQLRDLYVINDKLHPEISKGGKFSIYDPYTIYPPIKSVSRSSFYPKKQKNLWGKDLVERMFELRTYGGVSFSFTGETMSLENNRVELSDKKDSWGVPLAKVFYKHHEYDRKLSKYCLDKVAEIMVDAGGEIRAFQPQEENNEGYGHNHGTLRAGLDHNSSVLDSNCQSHTVKGLYVLDSAWMPTAGASNPTLTQIANVYRVCDKMI